MTWERIITSAPVNSDAAKTMGAKGQSFDPSVKLKDHYTDCPELSPVDQHAKSQEFIDYTGRKFGNLTVVGKMKKAGKNVPASWVCRCVCGDFCTRRSRSLRDAERCGNSFIDRCGRCEYQRRLVTGEMSLGSRRKIAASARAKT